MPDSSQVTPVAFNCEGGLVLNRSTFLMQPGEALELENFEPDIEGGYRRINGFSKYVSAIVPQTSSASEKVLMVATFANKVVAARGTNIFQATPGGSSWTTIDATIVKYNEGDLQVPHIDPCDATLLICLQPSIEGGSTCFPLLNPPLRLENRRGGDGYFFFSSELLGGGRRQYDDDDDDDDNDNDNCSRGRERNALSLHHGGRVTKGNKIVIQLMFKYSGVDDSQTWLEVI